MTNAKWTPGPWMAHGQHVITGNPGGPIDALNTDDARLIAAAPEMADWLQRHYKDEEGFGETDRPMYIELRGILARIQGAE